MKKLLLLIVTLITLTGCNQPTTQTPPPPPSENILSQTTPKPPNSPPNPPILQNNPITSKSIGAAKLGMTLKELKNYLGSMAKFQTKSPYIVDFDAIEISQGGKIQYYILYPAGQPLKDNDRITLLLTENPGYKTEQKIGPGSLIKEAEKVYGKPTLSYNIDNEGREIVNFANQPKNLMFLLGNANNGTLAGLYPKVGGAYHETNKYNSQATIRAIMVSCPQQECK